MPVLRPGRRRATDRRGPALARGSKEAAGTATLGGMVRRITFAALLVTPFAGAAPGAEDGLAGGLFSPASAAGDTDAAAPGFDALAHPLEPDAMRSEPDSAGLLRSRSHLRTREPIPDGEIQSREVLVNLARLAAAREEVALGADARLRLNLFDDVDLRAVIERTANTRHGWSLSGRVDGDPHGMVTLVVHGDIVAGAVHSREGTFTIASRNGAIHTVRKVSGDFACGVDGRSNDVPNGKTRANASGTTASEGDDGSEVDLLVLFTQAALDVEGTLRGMQASIDLAVAWTNDAYEASGVNHRLNLVAAVLVDMKHLRIVVRTATWRVNTNNCFYYSFAALPDQVAPIRLQPLQRICNFFRLR